MAILLLDPEHQQPQSLDFPPINERLEQPDQADPAVEAFEQRVDVRKDHADRRRFIIIIDEEHQSRVGKGLHIFLNFPHLVFGQGDETPVT